MERMRRMSRYYEEVVISNNVAHTLMMQWCEGRAEQLVAVSRTFDERTHSTNFTNSQDTSIWCMGVLLCAVL